MEYIIGGLIGAVLAFAWSVRNVCKYNGASASQSVSAVVMGGGSIGGGGGPSVDV